MISELIERLKSGLRKTAAAFRETCEAAVRLFRSPAVPDDPVIAASEGNVLDTGKRYRKTSGHAPLFSLYTFFGNRQ